MHAPARSSSSQFFTPFRLLVLLVIFTLLFASWGVLAVSAWTRFGFGAESGRFLWVLLLPSLLFAPALLLSRKKRGVCLGSTLSYVYQVAAISVGFLSFFFLAGAATWIVGGGLQLLGAERAARGFAAVAFAGALAATLYGLANALFGLRVVRRDVVLAGLPVAWRGRTVALVTDLHFGHIHGRRFSQRVVERLRSLAPDLVLVGGDLFDGTEGDFDTVLAPWKLLAPPFGVHYVSGNHDDEASDLAYALRAGMRDLGGKKVALDDLQLLGLHYPEAADPEALRAFLAGAGIDRDRASLLLVHVPHPRVLPEIAAAGVSLSLHGHTHDGQVWPWSFLAKRAHGIYTYGLHPFTGGNLQVCTSSGAGSWGPPMRVGTRSEIVVLRLVGR